MNNSKVKVVKNGAAKTAELPSSVNHAAANARALERGGRRVQAYSKVTDEVAQSDNWMRNEPIPHGMDLFPQEWRLRYSDLFYPSARGGAVYIDTPGSDIEVAYCERKLAAYRKKGVRYTFVKFNEGAGQALERLDPVLPHHKALGVVE